jgi:hypothetical protein
VKSNRIYIIPVFVFLCFCLVSAIISVVVYTNFRNQPPSSLANDSGYYIRGSKVYYLEGFPGTAFVIEDANVREFKIIDSQYAMDDTRVYFTGSVIEDADPATFELLESPFSRDARHVYVSGTIFTDDPVNFEIVSGNALRDSQHIYWSTEIISDDPSNLVILYSENYYTYLRDSRTVFVNGNPIPGADLLTFEVIQDGYARDAVHIFYFGEVISEADAATFEILESPYARDLGSVFWMENLIVGADVSTFRILNANFECSADAKVAYYQDQPIANFDPASIPSTSQVTNCDASGMYFSP